MSKYNPSDKEKQTIKHVYDEFSYMRNLRNQKWQYFNDRTLDEFIDDSQLRLNGYVPSRESQGKEGWQSNVFHPVTRNKFKAMLASVALEVPQTRITARNEKSQESMIRADILKNLNKFSYEQDNKEEQIFFEAWESAEKGTVIVYDGYLKATQKRKIIKSYDPTTGDIETEEKEVETANQCVNFIVPLMNLYIKDWNIFDIQKQPSLCWVTRVDVDKFKKEFGKYPKYEHVKTSNQLTDENEQDTFFREHWKERNKDDEPIEVIRYYNKGNDEYIIVANGVLLHESPLILGKRKKYYPFAKTVFEPFASDFFYGNSLPNTLMGEQDVINALYNMALDKTYRSMVPPLLIGAANKDDFDLDDPNIDSDTRIYVQDIAQVREMPVSGVNAAEMNMIELISRGLDLSSVDSNQQGVAGRGVTAREVVIANENAKKLKGMMYMFLTSLWLQKIKLRNMNILIYYMQPKVDKVTGKGEEFQRFMVENTEFGDMKKGTLNVDVYQDKNKLPSPEEMEAQNEEAFMRGGEKNNYKTIAITADFLDDWIYDVKIVSESIYQKESGLTQAKLEDKMRMLATFFPDLIMQNKEKLAKDMIVAFDDDPDDYDFAQQQPQPQPGIPGQEGAQPGAEMATAGQAGLPPI